MARRQTLAIAGDVTTVNENVSNTKKEETKARWRDIERIKSKIALLKILKEIKMESDPCKSTDFMEF
ncbi:MAG: DUF3545 family protein [Succinivibrionaceae bacterium]